MAKSKKGKERRSAAKKSRQKKKAAIKKAAIKNAAPETPNAPAVTATVPAIEAEVPVETPTPAPDPASSAPGTTRPLFTRPVLIGLGVIAAIVLLAIFISWQAPRGQALLNALANLERTDSETTARTIVANYDEVRTNSKWWALTYWGMTFLAAAFSAAAGLVLKLDRFRDWRFTNDVAATLGVASALMIAVVATGDFRQKWQANRLAAAELEAHGYRLVRDPAQKDAVLAAVEKTMYQRQVAIIGDSPLTIQDASPRASRPLSDN